MAARSKTTRKKTASKKAAASGARKKSGDTAVKRGSSIEALAKKLLRVTNDLENADHSDLYAQECSSIEPGKGPSARVSGLPAREEKTQAWFAFVESQHWTARNVLVKGNTICIEWQAELKLRDGRVLTLDEVAVHEVRGGKIVAERFYYDPSLFAPEPERAEPAPRTKPKAEPRARPAPKRAAVQTAATAPKPAPEPAPEPPRLRLEDLEDEGPESPIDPIDL